MKLIHLKKFLSYLNLFLQDTKPLRVLELRLAQDVFRNNTCGKPNAFRYVVFLFLCKLSLFQSVS